MSYWLHPSAERELAEATAYYSEQASGRIASAFLTEFERVIAVLNLNQKIGTPVAEGLAHSSIPALSIFSRVPRS